MDQFLYKYLVLHKQLCIPQLGSFSVQKTHARYEEGAGLLHPPVQSIVFSEGVVPMSEKLFFDFLANEMGVDDVTAIKQFHDFSYDFRNRFIENGSVELKGVGLLEKDADGKVGFVPAPRYTDLLPPLSQDGAVLSLQNTVTEEEITEEETKDNWWVYALVLLILGAGALLFYYS